MAFLRFLCVEGVFRFGNESEQDIRFPVMSVIIPTQSERKHTYGAGKLYFAIPWDQIIP